MKTLVAALAAALAATLVCAGAAFAQEKKEMTEQQKRMQSCNADAKAQTFKDNDARQAFMSSCLKGEKPADSASLTPQQQRMKSCNAEAGKQQFPDGAARQAFMSKCLKG